MSKASRATHTLESGPAGGSRGGNGLTSTASDSSPVHARPSRRALGQMLMGNQIQQAIYVAARLRIPDLLRDGPHGIEDLAKTADANPDALCRLLRVLAGNGLFTEPEPQVFELTPFGALLCEGPGSMLSYALWSGGVSYRAFGGLEHSVRTGEPAFEHIFGLGFYDYLEQHLEVGSLFDELMSRHTRPIAPEVAAHGFGEGETVVDVGGGRGELLVTILGAHPSVRGVLVDRAPVLEDARAVLEVAGLADRCRLEPTDALDVVPPGGDAYLLKSLLHGMSDAEATRVLENCRDAMNPGGRLLLVELVLPPGSQPSPARLMDLLMLIGCQGRERTREEFGALLTGVGLRIADTRELRNGYWLIDARAV